MHAMRIWKLEYEKKIDFFLYFLTTDSCLKQTRVAQCLNSKSWWLFFNCCTGMVRWRRCVNGNVRAKKWSHTIQIELSTMICAHKWHWIGSHVSKRVLVYWAENYRWPRESWKRPDWRAESFDSQKRRKTFWCWHTINWAVQITL